MIQITDKSACCGCTACSNACPKKCISMQPDEEGFLYPVTDAESCIDCGLCEKVCPMISMQQVRKTNDTGYIVRNKEKEILMSSSSGGFFSALCRHVIQQNGIVCGAVFDSEWNVEHVLAETYEECRKFRGSKYVQSDLKDLFQQIRNLLSEGRLVCFSGTPCQVAGLNSYLRKPYSNLILVDFVCHGVPSPKLWDAYLAEKDRKHITGISFRSKNHGYQFSGMKLEYEDGRTYFGTARIDMMLKTFFSHIALRRTCYSCPFKTADRVSDFTVFDSWHAGELLGIHDDDYGYTSVLVRGENAAGIMEALKDCLDAYELELNKVIPVKGGMLLHSAKAHKKRDSFYSELSESSLKSVIQNMLPITGKDYVVEKAKLLFSGIGVAQVISRTKKVIRKRLKKES